MDATDDIQAYCRDKAPAPGSSRYYAYRWVPAETRPGLLALHALLSDLLATGEPGREPGVAVARLQWWQEEIGRWQAGHPRHPATRALAPYLERCNLLAEYFQELLDGIAMDLGRDAMETWSDLALYAHRTGGMTQLLVAELLGIGHRATRRHATGLGTALRLAAIIRNLGRDLRQGRLYLPADELAALGLRRQDLERLRTPPALVTLLQGHAERVRRQLDRARGELAAEDRAAQRPGLILAALCEATLVALERDGFAVLERRLSLTPLRKLWIAWRTEARERRLCRRLAAGRSD